MIMEPEAHKNTLNQLAKERSEMQSSVATQRIAPDLKAEGYEMTRGYINKQDGELYYLKVISEEEAALPKRTHQLKNEYHFWDGTIEDFREQFERA
jgi:hypothetical protein